MNNMDSKKLIGGAIGLVVSLAVLYGTVYLVSKAWHKGQS